jgi:transmembrane 9 superfamily protein 2/4
MMHICKHHTMWAALALVLLVTTQTVSAFYIPGFTPVSYKDGQQVQLDVNKIFSKNAQLPYAYSELDFVCQPKGPIKRTWLNLGEILRGDRFVTSDFQVSSYINLVQILSIPLIFTIRMTATNEER